MPNYEYYQRAIDNTPLRNDARFDPELGIYYVDDFLRVEQNDPAVLRKTNLEFLKILIRNQLIQINGSMIVFLPFTKEKINAIVNDIEQSYLNSTFFDSDLHDDVFEYFQIVSPLLAYDPELKQQFIELNYPKFVNVFLPIEQREQAARQSCDAFLKDRSKLFCTYIFLRRCAILYRDTPYKLNFEELLKFLAHRDNLNYVKEKIRADTFLYTDDLWATGMHEWLERSQTVLALKRTAGHGQPPGTQTHLTGVHGTMRFDERAPLPFIFSEFNWLDIQFLIRTETKHVIFPHNLNGHTYAVYKGLKYTTQGTLEINDAKGGFKGQGQQTAWQDKKHNNPMFKKGFNAHVEGFFNNSHTLFEFMNSLHNFYENYILHEGTVNVALTRPVYLSDGLKSNVEEVGFFAQNKLRKPHEMINIWFRDFLIQSYIANLDNSTDELCFTYENDIFPELPPQLLREALPDVPTPT